MPHMSFRDIGGKRSDVLVNIRPLNVLVEVGCRRATLPRRRLTQSNTNQSRAATPRANLVSVFGFFGRLFPKQRSATTEWGSYFSCKEFPEYQDFPSWHLPRLA